MVSYGNVKIDKSYGSLGMCFVLKRNVPLRRNVHYFMQLLLVKRIYSLFTKRLLLCKRKLQIPIYPNICSKQKSIYVVTFLPLIAVISFNIL